MYVEYRLIVLSVIIYIHREMGKEYVSGEIEEIIRWSSTLKQEVPLLALNHVSYVCKSLHTSVKFYQNVLGFVLVKRPSSFDFEGAWYVEFFMILILCTYFYL